MMTGSQIAGFNIKNEEIFQTLTDSLPLAIILTSGEEQVSEYINPMFVKLFGYSIDDIPTIAEWWPLAYPNQDYRQAISKEWADKTAAARKYNKPIAPMQTSVTCKDGSIKIIQWNYTVIGKKSYACGLDLTEQELAKEKLEASTKHLELAQSTALLGSWEQDFAADELFWSDMVYQLFGLDPEKDALSVNRFFEMVHPDDREKVSLAFQRSLKPGAPQYDMTHRILRFDTGEVRYLHERCRHFRDADGNVTKSLGTVQDVTECELAQNDLAENEQRYVKAQRLGQVGNWEFELKTEELWASEEAKRIYGFGPKSNKFTVDEVEKCIPERERVHQALIDLIEKDEPYNLEFEIHPVKGPHSKTIKSIAEISKDNSGTAVKVSGVIQDITERKQHEMELRKSRKMLSDIVEAIPDMLWMKDANGKYLLSNRKFEKLVKSSKEQIIGQTDYDLFPEEKANFYCEHDQIAIRNKRTIANEESADFIADGYSTWIETLKTPLFGENNELIGVLGIGRDISRRRQALEESEEKQTFLKMLVDYSPIPMWVASPNGTVLQVNKALCSTLNLTPDQFVGKYNLFRDDNNNTPEIVEKIDALMTRKERIQFSLTWKPAEVQDVDLSAANACTMDLSIYPLLNSEDEITHIICQWVDVTERNKTEQALKDEESKFRALYENAPLPYQSLDKKGCFIDINPAWLRTLGYEREEVIGARYADFLHPDWKPHFEKNFPAFKKRGYVSDVQFKIRHKDGRFLDISFEGCIAYNLDGSFKQTYCVFQDITERKRAEEALLASEERFRTICNNAPIFINGFDENGRCAMWNEQCRKTFGWTIDEINAQADTLSLLYPDPAIRDELLQTLVNEPDGHFREWHPQTKDGKVLSTLWANFRLPNGQIFGMGYDDTERKKAEDELNKSHVELEERVDERTKELRKIVNAMAGRENRMADLKRINKSLLAQLENAGIAPTDTDLLLKKESDDTDWERE